MKASIIIFIVLFALSVESAKKHKMAMKSSVASDSRWPQPELIRDFEVPPDFTAPPVDIADNTTEPTVPPTTPLSGKHHGKSIHKKSHS